MDIDAFINAAIAKLADLTVDPVVQWTIACELIALKYERFLQTVLHPATV